MPERDRLVAADPDRALGVDVVERAREGDDADLHAAGLHAETSKFSITGLESSVSAICRTCSSTSSVTSPDELELEPLALADVGHAGEAEPGQRAEDGLALRVEDLRLGHHVDDDLGHGSSLFVASGSRIVASPYRFTWGSSSSGVSDPAWIESASTAADAVSPAVWRTRLRFFAGLGGWGG